MIPLKLQRTARAVELLSDPGSGVGRAEALVAATRFVSGASLEDAAAAFGVTKANIRQIEIRALKHMSDAHFATFTALVRESKGDKSWDWHHTIYNGRAYVRMARSA